MPPASEPPFDPASALVALADADVDFVVIGGVAGGAHGSSYGTPDLDVAYRDEAANVERLRNALLSLGAAVDAGVADRRLETRFGTIDVYASPIGVPPYARLKADSVAIDLRGRTIRVASLDHLIAMKEACGRTRDELLGTEYRVLSDVIRARRA